MGIQVGCARCGSDSLHVAGGSMLCSSCYAEKLAGHPGYLALLDEMRTLHIRESNNDMVDGVGPDVATGVNERGGRQSAIPYRCDLLPPRAVLSVAGVLHAGAEKYGIDNWRNIEIRDHVNHALTHLFAYLAGDSTDAHLSHASCRVLMALDMEEATRGQKNAR